MQQLQLIDQSSQLLDDLVNTVLSPTLSRSAKLAEIGRILAHFDLPIEAPRVAGQLWSATELGKELGVSAQAIGRLANQHQLKRPAFGEYRLDQAVSSRPSKTRARGSTTRISLPTSNMEIIVPTPRGAITMPVVKTG